VLLHVLERLHQAQHLVHAAAHGRVRVADVADLARAVDDHRAAACLKVGKKCRVGCSGEKDKMIPFHAHVFAINSMAAQDH
jgi:hypothetical protein